MKSPEQSRFRLPPGPAGVPLLGILPAFRRDPLAFLLSTHERHGMVAGLAVPLRPAVAVFGSEATAELLLAPTSELDKAAIVQRPYKMIAGTGIITADGEEHRAHRQVVQRAFQNQYLRGYQASMRETTREALERWRPGQVFDLVPEITRLSKSVATRVLLGEDLVANPSALSAALDLVCGTLDTPSQLLPSALVPFDIPGISIGGTLRRSLSLVHEGLSRFIDREDARENRSIAHTLLAVGRELVPGWGIEQVMSNVIQLFLTGYDTTSCAVTWTLYLLAQHPDACRALLAELHEKLDGRDPDMGELGSLDYLDAVVKESLRLYPTGPYGFRVARKALRLGGYALPEGTLLAFSPWVNHRIESVFEDALEFRPERFLKGRAYPKGAYIPFGLGARSCVGATFSTLQMKTVVAMAMQRFRLEILPGQRISAVSQAAIHLLPGLEVRVVAQDGHADRSRGVIHGDVVGALS
jgi:cytochrome P450